MATQTHHSDVGHLVKMANQIADAFVAAPHEEAVDGVANHIKSFWAPVMRNRLQAYASTHASEFRPLLLEGLARLHLEPHGTDAATGCDAG